MIICVLVVVLVVVDVAVAVAVAAATTGVVYSWCCFAAGFAAVVCACDRVLFTSSLSSAMVVLFDPGCGQEAAEMSHECRM